MLFTVPVPTLVTVRPDHGWFISVSMTETITVPELSTINPDPGREVIVTMPLAVLVPRLVPVPVIDLSNAVAMINGTRCPSKELVSSNVGVICTGYVLAQDLFNGVGHSLTTECACR